MLGLSGCGEVNSTQTQPADKTAAASQKPKKNSRGNIVKHVGEEAGVTGEDGKDVVSWTVTGINPNPQCTESYQTPVKNGHLIALDVIVSTTPKLKDSEYNPFSIGSGSLWKYIQKDGTLWNGDLLNASTVSCTPQEQSLPTDIGPDAKAQGKAIPNVPATDGYLVFSQMDMDGWEYQLQ
ncbi:hypothetical protein [Bifidobacterium apicola]|uniref:hypothetical protein n=1 Tax=Bifidobacterium apicola TaxID=3230739 RepID=UPI0036F252A3